jgi:hypothetical protein
MCVRIITGIILHIHMIYINNNNIYTTYVSFNTNIIGAIENNTGYLPVRVCKDILLMSDSRLYRLYCGYESSTLKLLTLKIKRGDDYVVDYVDFTDKFVKINSSGEYYEIYGNILRKIQVVANNCRNIHAVYKYKMVDSCHCHCYYYVSINNELIFFDSYNKSEQHLDDNVNSILYFNSKNYSGCIIYVKNNIIICSNISNFTQLTDHYVIDYVGQLIIKSSDDFILDSHGDLYQLISDGTKFILKKISSAVVDFYCDVLRTYIIDTESKIYCIDKYNYSKNYIDVGHLAKLFSNTKSANNTYKQM